jgi:hypothetical protein
MLPTVMSGNGLREWWLRSNKDELHHIEAKRRRSGESSDSDSDSDVAEDMSDMSFEQRDCLKAMKRAGDFRLKSDILQEEIDNLKRIIEMVKRTPKSYTRVQTAWPTFIEALDTKQRALLKQNGFWDVYLDNPENVTPFIENDVCNNPTGVHKFLLSKGYIQEAAALSQACHIRSDESSQIRSDKSSQECPAVTHASYFRQQSKVRQNELDNMKLTIKMLKHAPGSYIREKTAWPTFIEALDPIQRALLKQTDFWDKYLDNSLTEGYKTDVCSGATGVHKILLSKGYVQEAAALSRACHFLGLRAV